PRGENKWGYPQGLVGRGHHAMGEPASLPLDTGIPAPCHRAVFTTARFTTVSHHHKNRHNVTRLLPQPRCCHNHAAVTPPLLRPRRHNTLLSQPRCCHNRAAATTTLLSRPRCYDRAVTTRCCRNRAVTTTLDTPYKFK